MDSNTPWIAAAEGDLPLLQRALQELHHSSPPLLVDENGYTLFHAAASYGHLHILDWLFNHSSYSSTTTTNSSTGSTANVDSVEQYRVSLVTAVDVEGDSALHYATTVAVAEFLVHVAQMDPRNYRNNSGLTPLESKQQELTEMEQDEDNDTDDDDYKNLRDLVAYLSKFVDSDDDLINSSKKSRRN